MNPWWTVPLSLGIALVVPLEAQDTPEVFIGAGIGLATLDADNLESRTGPVGRAFLGYRPFHTFGIAIEGSQFRKSVGDQTYTLTRFGGILIVYPPGVDWLRLKAGAGYSEYAIERTDGTISNEDLGFLLGIEGSYGLTAKFRLEPYIEWARHDFSVRDQEAQMLQVGVALRFVIHSSSVCLPLSSRTPRSFAS